MNGAPVSLIVRATKRTKSRRGASESERARETNDETVREDAAAGRAREKEWKSGESPVVGRVTNNARMRLGLSVCT